MRRRYLRRMVRTAIFAGTIVPASLLFSSLSRAGAMEMSSAAPAAKIFITTEEIQFTNGATVLAGTLFKPDGESFCPALVVMTGSDRSARTPLRMAIGKEFANRGVAALVYDSPGTGSSTGNALMQSRKDRADEALAAVHYLRGRSNIIDGSVGLYGVSEGADVVLIAAAQDSQLAFAIPVSASAGGSIFEIMSYSAEKKGYQLGLSPEEIAQAITFKEATTALLTGREIVEWSLLEERTSQWDPAIWKPLIDAARQTRYSLSRQQQEALQDTLRIILDRAKPNSWYSVADPDNRLPHLVRLPVEAFFAFLETSSIFEDWERDFCLEARSIRCPVLAIWGSEDSFLPPHRSAERLKKFLATSDSKDVSVIMFDGANHTLTITGPQIEFVPGYFDSMSHWILQHVPGGFR